MKENKDTSILLKLTKSEKERLLELSKERHISASKYLVDTSIYQVTPNVEKACEIAAMLSNLSYEINMIKGDYPEYQNELATISEEVTKIWRSLV